MHRVKIGPVWNFDDEVFPVAGKDHMDSGQVGTAHIAVVLYGGPHRILEQLW